MAFANVKLLERHFLEHGTDFGSGSPGEYEKAAILFLKSPRPSGVEECRRSGGNLVRFEGASNTFGVLGSTGVVKTFFKPIRCSDVPVHLRAMRKMSGRCHEKADNLTYFKETCARP